MTGSCHREWMEWGGVKGLVLVLVAPFQGYEPMGGTYAVCHHAPKSTSFLII